MSLMQEKFQPKKNIEVQSMREQAQLTEIATNKRWEDLTADKFPFMATIQARPFYFTKLGIINQEIQILNGTITSPKDGGFAIAQGRLLELKQAASDTLTLLYPNVKPIEEDLSPVTPEELEQIELFVQAGAIEQLNSRDSQGWNQLSANQKLLYRLRALQVFYTNWKSVEQDPNLDESEPVGFDSAMKMDTTPARIKRVFKITEEKVIAKQLSEWLTEAIAQGTSEDAAMVKTALSLIEEIKNK